ncbi:MAG: hypothetical protein HY887_09795 [Deltaproteobacteria bacterium]|nr:hypothetical protein [Deltaproteobacteria bacterium]
MDIGIHGLGVNRAWFRMQDQINLSTTNLIKAKDADGDGSLSATELGLSSDIFSKIDVNGDDKASRLELNRVYPRVNTAANTPANAAGSFSTYA